MLKNPLIWATSSMELLALVRRAEFWSNTGSAGPLKEHRPRENSRGVFPLGTEWFTAKGET